MSFVPFFNKSNRKEVERAAHAGGGPARRSGGMFTLWGHVCTVRTVLYNIVCIDCRRNQRGETQVMSISEQQQDSFIMAYRTLLQGVSSVSFSAGGKEAVITCKTRTAGRHGDW